MKKCDNCSELVQETIEFEGQQYCRKCVFHAKRLGAMAEIARRSQERKLPMQAIVDELIIYALEVQKELAKNDNPVD